MRIHLLALAVVLVAIVGGCEMGPKSGLGLRLPEGDLDRGALAFHELGCGTCHDVVGHPPPSGERAEVIVRLGGEVTRVNTYGELVTSIINPSHKLSRRYAGEDVSNGDVSKMKNFNDIMTVAQLIDLTAYLQATYEVRREPLWLH